MRRRLLKGGEVLQIKILKIMQRFNLFNLNHHKNKSKRKLLMFLLKKEIRRAIIIILNNLNQQKKDMNSLYPLPKIENLFNGWILLERDRSQLKKAWDHIRGLNLQKKGNIFLIRPKKRKPLRESMIKKIQ